MVNIGILGNMNCGKTASFLLFMKYLEETGSRIIQGVPGGAERDRTETVDFIRFTYKGFVHVLYGTGGHNTRITDYYRLFVLRNADRFLCMFDLSEPLRPQLEFYSTLDIPTRSVVISLNKYDLAADQFEKYKEDITNYFSSKLKKLVKEPIFATVAIEAGDKYKEENKNCLAAVLSLCGFAEAKDAFDIWEGQ
ncbi:MAG: GTPase domain-containing protein [Candidatus Hodarchaeales archaeon]